MGWSDFGDSGGRYRRLGAPVNATKGRSGSRPTSASAGLAEARLRLAFLGREES